MRKKQPPLHGSWPELSVMMADAASLFSKPTVLTTLVLCASILVAYVMLSKSKSEKKWAVTEFSREALGSIVMVFCTFTPGPFLGHHGGWEEWTAHFGGLLLSSYMCGDPHVNPSVSFAFFVWRKISWSQVCLLWAGQMAGGLIAFPLLQACSSPYGVEIWGPAIASGVSTEQAMWAEFLGTFILLAAVFVFCTTWLGQYWVIKQSLVAIAIRFVCVLNDGTTGPAINPMLGTTWALFKHHGHESFPPIGDKHYHVYWIASIAGSAVAALLWSLLWTDGVFAPPIPKDKVETKKLSTMEEAWAVHASHFEKLTPENRNDPSWAKILQDYDDNATLVMSILTNGENDNGKTPSMAPSRSGKKGFLVYLQSTRTKNDKEQADEVIVDEATRSVFLKWHSTASEIHGTDTYFFNDEFKIVRQHTTMSSVSPPKA